MALSWYEIRNRISCITKKDAFIYISVFLLAFLFGAVLNDIIHLTLTEKTHFTTRKDYTTHLLLLHAVAVYLGLQGFVYTTEKAGHAGSMSALSVSSIIGNILVLVFRITVELCYIKYREEMYRNVVDSGK